MEVRSGELKDPVDCFQITTGTPLPVGCEPFHVNDASRIVDQAGGGGGAHQTELLGNDTDMWGHIKDIEKMAIMRAVLRNGMMSFTKNIFQEVFLIHVPFNDKYKILV